MIRIRAMCILLFSLTLSSCKDREVKGIVIAETLYVHQDYKVNKELRSLIEQALNHNEKAIVGLTSFPCGGGAGCYDLGYILTQIIYRVDEKAFVQMVLRLDQDDIRGLRSLIQAGLEYGDNDQDGKQDNRRIEDEFPTLDEVLRK